MKKYKTGIWLITNDQRINVNENIENAVRDCEQVLSIFVWDEKLKRSSSNSKQASFFYQSLSELNKLLEFIKNDKKTGILLIEHDMSVVMGISDHVVVLNYGRKIFQGSPSETRKSKAVIEAYLGVDE